MASELPPVSKWNSEREFRAKVKHWSKKIKIESSTVHLRPMAKKWASCSKSGLLSFNTDLLDERKEFGEYVIVHELLHLRVPNHGMLFKSLLKAYLPDWKERANLQTTRRGAD